MTGMTCTFTDKNKNLDLNDKTGTKTAEKSVVTGTSSPLGVFSKSNVGNSPIATTMYGVPFIRENDSGLQVHSIVNNSGIHTTKHGDGREKIESYILTMKKKKSDFDNTSARGKRSQMSRRDAAEIQT